MHRVALIYNPVSGQHPQRRAAFIKRVVAVLHSAAIEVKVIPTESAESVETQAQEAIREGCDTILACGGDGTVHEVLQSVVGTSAALGVIPKGTASALAADLGLPPSPEKSAKRLLAATSVRVSVGPTRARLNWWNASPSNAAISNIRRNPCSSRLMESCWARCQSELTLSLKLSPC
ncbi:MAG: hypothetical protein JWQ87_4868 [Candidatus Sulfotelmatobacter sp.]|nr:hypothetical protein [Candidatus Sulfotelmatobacter sp.]